MKIKLKIEDLASDGAGIGRHEGKVVFVPLVLPGEEAWVQVVENKKEFMRARLLTLESESPQRTAPPCPYFGRCGGCQLQHVSYAGQLAFKRAWIKSALRRFGRFEQPPEIEVVPSPDDYGYRNKMIFPVRPVRGAATLGFYKARSHDVVPIARCLVAGDGINSWIDPVNRFIADWNVYSERRRAGTLRHVILRAFDAGPCQVTFVVFDEAPAAADYDRLGAPSVWINRNPEPGNVILGPDWTHVRGLRLQEVAVAGRTHLLHPGAFFQANTRLLGAMLELAERNVVDGLPLIDLYGGAGFFGRHLGAKVPRVVVVEENPLAVESGRAGTAAGGPASVEIVQGPAEAQRALFQEMRAAGFQLVLDPPRKGCSPEVLSSILDSRPRRILYYSCHAAACVRDLAVLARHYALDAVYLLDLFPQTSHAEMCAVLTLR